MIPCDLPPVPKRHHFLPVAYLAAFTEDGSKDGILHVFPRDGSPPRKARPRRVGFERGLYALETIAGPEAEVLEHKVLERCDAVSPPVLRKIDALRELPEAGSNDYRVLMDFLATLAVRTPASQRAISSAVGKRGREWAEDSISSPQAWAEAWASLGKTLGQELGPAPNYEARREHAREHLGVDEVYRDAVRFGLGFWQERVFETMMERLWTLVVADPDGPYLLTSDNPVATSAYPVALDSMERVTGLADPLSVFTAPITRNVAVVGAAADARLASAIGVPVLNGRTLINCDRYVLSSTPEVAWQPPHWLRPQAPVAGRAELLALFAGWRRPSPNPEQAC